MSSALVEEAGVGHGAARVAAGNDAGQLATLFEHSGSAALPSGDHGDHFGEKRVARDIRYLLQVWQVVEHLTHAQDVRAQLAGRMNFAKSLRWKLCAQIGAAARARR